MRTRICDEFDIEFPIFAFRHCRDVVAAVEPRRRLRRARRARLLAGAARDRARLDRRARRRQAVRRRRRHAGVVRRRATRRRRRGAARGDDPASSTATSSRRCSTQYDVPPLPRRRADAASRCSAGRPARRARRSTSRSTHPIKLLVNALGPPPQDVVETAHEHGVQVAALVGSADQARKQKEAGVDIIVAPGNEAGGHTGEIAIDGARARGRRRRRAGARARRRRHRQRQADGGRARARRRRRVDRLDLAHRAREPTRRSPIVEKLLAADVARHRALALDDRQARAPAPHAVDRRVGRRPTRPARCRCRCSSCSRPRRMSRIHRAAATQAAREDLAACPSARSSAA